MFKMGCSMAKRILAIDKNSSSASSAEFDTNTGQGSSSKKSSKDKQALQGGSGGGQEGGKSRASCDELNDFSKLKDNPNIPLNVRQIFKITKSWKAIARTMSKTGTAMFLNLFEQNQDLFYLFDRFQHLKGKELHESMELREHAATVMSTLDRSINSLSDYDNFVSYLHSIGKLHRKVPGFKRDHFWKIEQPFLKAVKQTLDERCNETIEEIYKIAIKLIIETIAEGYGEDQDEAGASGTQRGPAGEGSASGRQNGEIGGAGGGGSNSSQGGGASKATESAAGNDNSAGGFAVNQTTIANNCQQDGQRAKMLTGCHIDTTQQPGSGGCQDNGPSEGITAEAGQPSNSVRTAGQADGGSIQAEGILFALRDLLALLVAKQQSKGQRAANDTKLETPQTRVDDLRTDGAGTIRRGSCSSIDYNHLKGAITTGPAPKEVPLLKDAKRNSKGKCYSATSEINRNSWPITIPIHSSGRRMRRWRSLDGSLQAHSKPNDKVDASEQIAKNNNNNNNTITKLGHSINGDAISATTKWNELNLANIPPGSQFPSQHQQQAHKYQEASAKITSTSNCLLLAAANLESSNKRASLDCFTLMGGGGELTNFTTDNCLCPNDRDGQQQLASKLNGIFRTKKPRLGSDKRTISEPNKASSWTAASSLVWLKRIGQSSLSLIARKRRKPANKNKGLGGATFQKSSTNKCIQEETTIRTPTTHRKSTSNTFVLTNNSEDLCEFIKMLMLTVASRKVAATGGCLSQVSPVAAECAI